MTAGEENSTSAGFLLGVAPNGARRTKADHPALPLTPAELAREAAAVLEAGATYLHLHVRDKEGRHSLDPRLYAEAITAIRQAVGQKLIIQITSEAVGLYKPAEQRATIHAVKPEAVSLALREFLPDPSEEKAFADLTTWLAREAIAAQYILYEPAELSWFLDLKQRGIVPPGHRQVLFVLGRYKAGQQSDPADLLPFLASGKAQAAALSWSVCAFGPLEAGAALAAISLGGHARVGFENNLARPDGSLAAGNAEVVTTCVKAAALIGKKALSAEAAREAF